LPHFHTPLPRVRHQVCPHLLRVGLPLGPPLPPARRAGIIPLPLPMPRWVPPLPGALACVRHYGGWRVRQRYPDHQQWPCVGARGRGAVWVPGGRGGCSPDSLPEPGRDCYPHSRPPHLRPWMRPLTTANTPPAAGNGLRPAPTPPNTQRWAWNVLCTSALFTLPFFLIWSTINSIAWAQVRDSLPVTRRSPCPVARCQLDSPNAPVLAAVHKL